MTDLPFIKVGIKRYLERELIPLGKKIAKSEISFTSLSAANCFC